MGSVLSAVRHSLPVPFIFIRFSCSVEGKMTQAARDMSLDQIRTGKATSCILISIKAGATGEPHRYYRILGHHFECSRSQLDCL